MSPCSGAIAIPTRRRGRDLLSEEDERLAQRLQGALGQLVDGHLVGKAGEQDRELVSADTCHGVLAPHRRGEALGHLLDQIVAGSVPEGVVDRLEVVEVDEEHAHRLAHPAGAHQFLLDPVLEEPAVGQSGEGVVPRHVRDLLEQVEVLQRGGGLIGKAGQAFVEVGIVDGGGGSVGAEVGRDHTEELAGGEERSDHRGHRARLLHEAA